MKKIYSIGIQSFTVLFFCFAEATCVFAEMTVPQIEGEQFFNETAAKMAGGGFSLSFGDILQYICDNLFLELRQSRTLLISIFVIAVISGILNIMKNEDSGTNDAAFLTCFCLMTVTAARIIGIIVGYGADVIKEMCDFVTKLAPIMSVLLISSGYATTAASFYPVFSASVYFIGVLVDKCIVPLIYAGCVTGIMNNMSGKLQLNNLNKLIKSVTKWILTFCLTVFSGINAIYGFVTPSADSVGIKTAKFALGSFVPVVGAFLSESVDAVLSGTKLVKNAVGTAGIAAIFVMFAIPCIKICAALLIVKLSAALIEPICDKRFSDMLSETSDAMFVFSLSIVIALTNTI